MRWNTVAKIYATLVVSLFGIVALTLMYWLLQPADIITDISPKVGLSVPANQIKAGSTIYITRYYCLNTVKYFGITYRSFIDHVVYYLPELSTSSNVTGVGCKERTFLVDVPSMLPSGDYEYSVVIKYELNPIRNVIYTMPKAKIYIINEVQDKLLELAREKM